jgi:hypothetical protein
MNISTRNGGIAGIVAGIAFIVQAAIQFIHPQIYAVFVSRWDYVNETLFAIALVATIFCLIAFHSFAQNRYGRGGAVGFWLTVIGTSLLAIRTIASLFAGKWILDVAGNGVLLLLIGYPTLGFMAWRGKVLPVWGALAFGLGLPLAMFLIAYDNGILFGLGWLGVGYFLLKQQSSMNDQVTQLA